MQQDGTNRTSGAKRIRGLDFTVGELSETERDLIRAIEGLDAEKELIIRLSRIISRKFAYARNVVQAQDWLESKGFLEITGRDE